MHIYFNIRKTPSSNKNKYACIYNKHALNYTKYAQNSVFRNGTPYETKRLSNNPSIVHSPRYRQLSFPSRCCGNPSTNFIRTTPTFSNKTI